MVEKESVLKYGGFYIGRYEMGADGTIKRGNYAKRNVSFETAKNEAETMYNDSSIYGVKSSLPSGASWERIGEWLIETNNKTFGDIYANSASWGKYNSSSASNSGSSESYCSNNIYDLAGNLSEWTTETEKEGAGKVVRGSSYQTTGMPTFISSDLRRTSDQYTGYRPILYFYN